jgi:hypothetical protein
MRVSGFTKVRCPKARSDSDCMTENINLSVLENINSLFCTVICRFGIALSFFRSNIEKCKSFRLEKKMEKNDCCKLIMKLNIGLSYYSNSRLERTRINYAAPRDEL